MHRVTKPSVVLSGVFKEERAQITTKLESYGYTVRDRLLVGGQKDCYLMLGKEFKQSKVNEALLANIPIVKPTFFEAIVAKPDQVPDPSMHAYKTALPRRRQHADSRRYYSTEQKLPAKVKQCRAMTRKVVALEGQIGVGKSTLCGKIKELFSTDVAIYKEQTNELFLKLFYSNPAKYGFAFQWGMLKTRVYQLRLAQQDIKHGRHPDKQFFFWDRSMIGDYTFALWNHLLGSISREEMDVYESEFGGSMKEFDKIPFLKDIGLFVYLNDEPAQCKFRVEQHRKNGCSWAFAELFQPAALGTQASYHPMLACSLRAAVAARATPLQRAPFTAKRLAASRRRTMAAAATAAASTAVKQDYDALCKKLKEVSALSGISGLLGWDEMVQLPPNAVDARAAQKSALAGVLHEKQTEAEIGQLLQRLQAANLEAEGLNEYERATVREAARDYRKLTAVPKELAQKEAELESRGYQAWVKARQESDFAQFAPVLQEWVDLRRQKARLVDPSKPVYDVLLDDYEKGVTAARLDEIFGQVKAGLVPLLADLRARGKAPSDAWLKGDFDTKKQAELCHKIAVALGFSLDSGRLDVSVHPFTGGAHPTDVRMTTRFKQDDLTEGITGAIHETGHALYEQGRNLQYDGLPVNQALGMGVHESQSLLWERMVGLSRHFAAYLLPLMREYFPQLPKEQGPEDLYAALNIIKQPSMIRVESDEVTYPLHIILRYELEKALVEGSIQVADLPQLWNQKMKEYLGCEPESDARGVLQDVHWSAGLFGYFPTYSLGAMYATQIFKAAEKELPGLADDIAAGKFERLKGWLNEKIHKVGSLPASGDELMVAVTGAPLQPAVFLDYLKAKYSELYQL